MDRQLHDSIFDGGFRLPSRAPADSGAQPKASARAHSVERRLKTLPRAWTGTRSGTLSGYGHGAEERSYSSPVVFTARSLHLNRLKYNVLVPGRHLCAYLIRARDSGSICSARKSPIGTVGGLFSPSALGERCERTTVPTVGPGAISRTSMPVPVLIGGAKTVSVEFAIATSISVSHCPCGIGEMPS